MKEFEANSILLERKLKNKSEVVKRYNIGATLTIGEFVLPNLLGDYKRTHNNIDVIMHVHNLEELLKRMSNGEFDWLAKIADELKSAGVKNCSHVLYRNLFKLFLKKQIW